MDDLDARIKLLKRDANRRLIGAIVVAVVCIAVITPFLIDILRANGVKGI